MQKSYVPHPKLIADLYSESLQTELEIVISTTNAEEELASKYTEVHCAASSAAYKQMNHYKKHRKDILNCLIKEKKEYLELLKERAKKLPK